MKNVLLIVFIVIGLMGCTAQKSMLTNVTERHGKVGIGTTTPDELLTVKGKIHTQEVIVDLKGAVAPDYVFESYFDGTSLLKPEYQFPTLKEVGSYIAKHRHLPEILSAKQLEEEGLALKQMNLLLLQKIEELTIYTLQQQEQIDELRNKISEIEK